MDGLIRVAFRPGQRPRVGLPGDVTALQGRLKPLLNFVERAAAWLKPMGYRYTHFAVQLHDEDPGEEACFRFDAPLTCDGGGPLIPDPYALGTDGFAAVRASFEQRPLPPWSQRLPIAFWRGSSTGTADLCPANLAANRRYQLCRQSLEWPRWLDARFTALVQTADAKAHGQLSDLLHQQELLAPRVDPWHFALHRWLIEIDGNVNSWGLLWKLLSGSCVLRVGSQRRQWYHHRLLPWVHVVPVAADLSDLRERLIWCQSNPQTCGAIAAAGLALGQEVVAALEQDQRQAVETYAKQWLT